MKQYYPIVSVHTLSVGLLLPLKDGIDTLSCWQTRNNFLIPFLGKLLKAVGQLKVEPDRQTRAQLHDPQNLQTQSLI